MLWNVLRHPDVASGALPTDQTGGLITMDSDHKSLHSGQYFQTGVGSYSVANNATYEMLFWSGPSPQHIKPLFAAEGTFRLNVVESCTVVATGTAISVFNMERSKAPDLPSSSYITHQGSFSNGITFWDKLYASGRYPDQFGVGGFVMKPSTLYGFRATNVSGGGLLLGPGLEWHEGHVH